MHSVIKFGRQTHWSESSMMYPGNEQLQRLPRYKKTRLAAIIYKQVENMGNICAVMLVFTNGFKTPLFETLNVRLRRYEYKRINLDTSRRISKVSLKVNKNIPELMLGLRLIDSHGHYILDHTWCTEEYMGNYWDTKQIPDYREIIGIKFVASDTVKELGFVLWTPDIKRRRYELEK